MFVCLQKDAKQGCDATKLDRTHCAGQRPSSMTSTTGMIKLYGITALCGMFWETNNHQNLTRLRWTIHRKVNRKLPTFMILASILAFESMTNLLSSKKVDMLWCTLYTISIHTKFCITIYISIWYTISNIMCLWWFHLSYHNNLGNLFYPLQPKLAAAQVWKFPCALF